MDFAEVAFAEAGPVAEQANNLANKLEAANNVAKLVFEVRDSSDDPKLVAFREFRENALKQIEAAENEAEKYIREAGLVNVEPVDVDALTKEYSSLADTYNKLRNAVVAIAGEDSVKAWPNIVRPAGTKKAGAATGTPKPRWQNITVGGEEIYQVTGVKEGVETRAVTLTALAQWMNEKLPRGTSVDTAKLRDEVFTAAGTRDMASLNGKPFTMAFTVGDKTWSDIVLTPKVSE